MILKKAYTYTRQEKIASFLLEQNLIDNEGKQISYSHEEIASLVGLSRVTVTKVLNDFAKKGYIRVAYRKINIIDRNGLVSILKDKD